MSSSTSAVRIHLDYEPSHVYTNMDTISGKVLLDLLANETITTIQIKMEGMAVTKMMVPKYPGDPTRLRMDAEGHKILYKTQTLFPEGGNQSNNQAGTKLSAGHYSYPFSFKIPINNKCAPIENFMTKMGPTGAANPLNNVRHVTNTLPPSLSSLPNDEAWIRYFLKVTVARPKFYQMSLRKAEFFILLPIEPPRPPYTGQEVYARREHVFPVPYTQPAKKSLFSRSNSATPDNTQPAVIFLEARLPSPPIIEPNQPLPLRLMVRKCTSFTEPVVIRGLQFRLLSNTNIRTTTFAKNVAGSVHVMSDLNMKIVLGENDTEVDKILEVDPRAWQGALLTNALQPNFTTCNISRTYQLEITASVSWGLNGPLNTISLILPAEVYSGIPPPPQLLSRLQQPPNMPLAGDSKQGLDIKTPVTPSYNSPMSGRPGPGPGPGPTSGPGPSNQVAAAGQSIQQPAGQPAQQPAYNDVHEAQYGAEFDAPPTYDEAVAHNVNPVGGPRRDFQQDPAYFQGATEIDNDHQDHHRH